MPGPEPGNKKAPVSGNSPGPDQPQGEAPCKYKPPKSAPRRLAHHAYDTIVIRGATGKDVPREVDGGEVVSWARGHELAAGDALLEFVNYVADGDCGITPELSTKARKALDLMERRSRLGWEAGRTARGLAGVG
ncbi:Uncharacterised protein [Pseudomonas aeruginosa]|nr:Uncharacterised protein [Pseudomonas aeruginosa]